MDKIYKTLLIDTPHDISVRSFCFQVQKMPENRVKMPQNAQKCGQKWSFYIKIAENVWNLVIWLSMISLYWTSSNLIIWHNIPRLWKIAIFSHKMAIFGHILWPKMIFFYIKIAERVWNASGCQWLAYIELVAPDYLT